MSESSPAPTPDQDTPPDASPDTPQDAPPETSQDAPSTASGLELPQFKNNRELLYFLMIMIQQNRKWWLIPFFLVLAILSIFVSLTGNTALLPAIYALF